MDFMNRGGRPVQQNTQTQTQEDGVVNTHVAAGKNSGPKSSKYNGNDKMTRIFFVGFLGVVTVLLIAVVLLMSSTKNVASSELDAVKGNQFQAVFLNGGQVYFGKINDINSRYLNMNNIYYLRVNQQVQPDQANSANAANDISLVKLGCELHGPEDSMVIYRDQVIFWENLKTDGQVAKAVDEYVKANPNGQDCNQQNGATNTESTTPAATTPATTKTPAATTPATTKTR